MELQDHAGAGHDALMAARDQLIELAGKNSSLTRVRHNGLDDSPQLQIDIDQRKAQALGVSIDDINDTLQNSLGIELRQRLYGPWSREEGLCSGRSEISYVAG
ncbi:Acriflavine resistance protein F Protein envD [Salmonella enterica subsp. enterica]|uniref:Acriflavine resistance protein F Protein envD n=1 Tax=Salmonella enterica I TaxID=59201 RepID=A0A447N6K5_SALET|nr:Acriflavine resistance protein F Protein envD [Salmonella enterica subsp. enterica]